MNKYHAKRTDIDGYIFDSKAEARRYSELKLMLGNGDITDLAVHPAWQLVVNRHKICRYTADFSYCQHGKQVVEDVKGGANTRDYTLRKKLMAALHGIEVIEIRYN